MQTTGSASAATALTVTPAVEPSVTQVLDITYPSNPNPPYPLTAIVGGNGAAPPTGTLSFVNTSAGNAIIGTSTLGSGQPQLSLLNSSALEFPESDSVAEAMVKGDFNNDGIPDLAVTLESNNFQIFLGDGHGGFTPGQTFPTSATVVQVILAADFNSDGNLDLAINTANDGVYVYPGNGDGTFQTSAVISLTGFLIPVAVTDFNLDGLPDIAASSSDQAHAIILLGNGDGTFTATQANPVARSPIVVLQFGLPIRRKYWQLVLLLCAVTGLLMTSCGGGSSGSSTPPPHVTTVPGTTAGNYVFTVTGTDSSHANTTLSVNVTMTVQ